TRSAPAARWRASAAMSCGGSARTSRPTSSSTSRWSRRCEPAPCTVELRRPGSGRLSRIEKRKRQEAILSLIRKHAIATQEDLVAHLRRAGVRTTQATVSRDIAELGLARVPGSGPGLSRYAQLGEGLGAASTAAREERLQRLLR